MEGLNLLQSMLQKGDYLCKLDLKCTYFCVPLKKESRKYVRFQWKGTLYEFLCLCFGPGPDPLKFTKILKVPISLLRRLQIRVIIYLDDMLLMSQTLEELLMSRDTIIFLLTHLGFVINLKKSILVPVQQIEFLGLDIDYVEMKLFLPQRKVEEIVQMSQNAMGGSLTLRDLTRLLGKLTSTISQLQIHFLQQIKIRKKKQKKHDLRICDYSGPAGQRGAVMVDNQHENLQWKVSVNSTPRSNDIFRFIEEGLGCFVLRDYHGGSMVFSGETLVRKCSRIGSSEASNSFLYKIQKTKFNLSTDRQHNSSLLLIKHGRNPEQTFNRNLEKKFGLSHREENTFDI